MARIGILGALLVAFLGSPTIAQNGNQGAWNQNTVRFVGDVICRNEFLGTGERPCSRWTQSPTLSTFGTESHHSTIIKNVIRQLNACLPDAHQIKILGPNDATATMKVYFLPLSGFAGVAKKHSIRLIPDNFGFFDIRWNDRNEIQQAIVLIAHDKLTGTRLHHFVLEEITQSLGLAGDSSRFEESIFYEDQPRKKYGTATRLSELDKKTIRLLYRHLQPGQHPVEVGIAMAEHWPSL